MHVDAVRRFNRFYTRRVGALRPGLLGSPYPLPQARVLYELGQRRRCTASDLVRELDLDPGYLSRLLRPLKGAGLVQGKRSKSDARASLLSLTAKGKKAFRALDGRSREEVSAMLGALADAERARLVGAMQAVERILERRAGESHAARAPSRRHGLGGAGPRRDLCARIRLGRALRGSGGRASSAGSSPASTRRASAAGSPRPTASASARCSWCAARSRWRSCAFSWWIRARAAAAWGGGWCEECIAFARARGYRRLELWTQSNLAAARAIYRACGFSLKRSEKHASFGAKLTGEYWELAL